MSISDKDDRNLISISVSSHTNSVRNLAAHTTASITAGSGSVLWRISNYLLGVWKCDETLFGVFEILCNTKQFDTILLKAGSYVLLAAITFTNGRVFTCSSGVKLPPCCFCYFASSNRKQVIKRFEKVQLKPLPLCSPQVRH